MEVTKPPLTVETPNTNQIQPIRTVFQQSSSREPFDIQQMELFSSNNSKHIYNNSDSHLLKVLKLNENSALIDFKPDLELSL